jgi:hypothetical protein
VSFKANSIQNRDAAAQRTGDGRVLKWGGTRCSAWAAAWLACGVLAACARYPESEYPPAPPPGVNLAEEDLSPAPPGMLWRRDVNAALDAGLGRFLQHVELQPQVEQGTFIGFRIVELRPPAWWQGVDLSIGDIVTQVNGMPIEQPTDAHAAFELLRTRNKLTVSYLRSGQARQLEYTIIDKPLAAPTPAS